MFQTIIKETNSEIFDRLLDNLCENDTEKYLLELEEMNRSKEFCYINNLLNPSFILLEKKNEKPLFYFANVKNLIIADESNDKFETRCFENYSWTGVAIGHIEKYNNNEKIIWTPDTMIQFKT